MDKQIINEFELEKVYGCESVSLECDFLDNEPITLKFKHITDSDMVDNIARHIYNYCGTLPHTRLVLMIEIDKDNSSAKIRVNPITSAA